MLNENEFIKWVKLSHSMYGIFEGRYDAYSLSEKWVREWCNLEKYIISEDNVNRLRNLIENIDYAPFQLEGDMRDKVHNQFTALILDQLDLGEHINIGFGFCPYLFTWNLRRFKNYFFKNQGFSLENYFESLNELFENKKNDFIHFQNMKLVNDEIESENIGTLFNDLNDKLKSIGIGQNEPVGTIKLLHIMAPHYFPLIDNPISQKMRLTRYKESLTLTHYLKLMKLLKNWLRNYEGVIGEIEEELDSSILKLVDEGLYIVSSVNISKRIIE